MLTNLSKLSDSHMQRNVNVTLASEYKTQGKRYATFPPQRKCKSRILFKSCVIYVTFSKEDMASLDEKLIKEVHSRDLLYNIWLRKYKDIHVKYSARRQIAEILGISGSKPL